MSVNHAIGAGWSFLIALSPLSLYVDESNLSTAVMVWGIIGITALSLKHHSFQALKPLQAFGVAMLWPIAWHWVDFRNDCSNNDEKEQGKQ